MTTDRDQPEPPGPPESLPPESGPPPARRGPVRRVVRVLAKVAGLAVVLLAAAIVTTFSVDLGPALRARAAKAGGDYLKREMTIGRLSIRLLTGTFIVEDLTIGGLEKSHRPFFVAKRIEVHLPLQALLHREILIESVELSDWKMLVETWPNGRHNFPKFTRDTPKKPGPKRFVTTVKYVHAGRGEFTFEDHGTPWSTVARNLDVVVRKAGNYGGTARFSKGTVAIQNYVPMWTDMDGEFTIDNGLVKFGRLDLVADGSVTKVTGAVDLARWPEQTWNVVSRVQFPRMRELFFAKEKWRLTGAGDFAGVFHLFKGGRELKGHFFSEATSVNAYRFQHLEGNLVWLPDRFEVMDARARLYGGSSRFGYRLFPLGSKTPTLARFDAKYENVDLAPFTDELQLRGIRFAGRATGRSLMEWPLGKFSAAVHGDGQMTVTPPPGVTTMTREGLAGAQAAHDRAGKPWGPFAPFPLTGYVPISADFTYRFDPASVEIAPSRFATEQTYVEFEGRTAWGGESSIPFHVTSGDWQESDRLLAGIMTAFGSNTGAVPVGGIGEFDGQMTKAFRDPRIEGRFSGQGMKAWDVVWGDGTADIVIENSYVTVQNSSIRHGTSTLEADGRFSLGYPRKDGGEEINARVKITDRPLADLRHAFLLDDYPVDGRLTGEFHLYGKYETPFGFGKMRIDDGIAYREPFDWAEGG